MRLPSILPHDAGSPRAYGADPARRISAHLRRALILLLGLVLALAASCGGDLGSTNYDPSDPRLEDALLEVVPPSSFNLRFEEEVDLRVRYVFEDGAPISGAPIDFEIVDPAVDASLAGRTATTGSDGVASMRLRAGLMNARFMVSATASRGLPVSFIVAVNDEDAGSIVVDMRYTGTQRFDRFTPHLFHGVDCATLGPETLPMAIDVGASVPRIVDRPGFAGVPVDTGYVVAVVAEIAGDVAGFGCTVGIDVMRNAETVADVEVLDWAPPLGFEGVYDLRNTFDFTGALPESVATALHVLDELTDDAALDGNPATEDWGQDPGAFVTDFIMRQTCHWECRAGEDYGTCSQDNHRLGDLRLLYTEDFTRWSGAQSRFFGGCGGWEIAARESQIFVNEQIGTYVPEIVLRFLDAAGDLSRAVTMAQIESVLTLRPVTMTGIPFTHELVRMEVSLRDLGGTPHAFVFDLADAGVSMRMASATAFAVGDELQIPAHTFQIHFGELVQYIYIHGLLPLFGFASTADMLREWIDCAPIATTLEREIGFVDYMTYFDYCEEAVDIAGDFIDDNIAGLIDVAAVLTIAGSARGTEVSTTGVAQRLEMGVWTGSWDEVGMSATVDGTFVGLIRAR